MQVNPLRLHSYLMDGEALSLDDGPSSTAFTRPACHAFTGLRDEVLYKPILMTCSTHTHAHIKCSTHYYMTYWKA